MTQPAISAIVPVYNEAELVRGSTQVIADALDRLKLPWEIVLVESGSFDGTGNICDELATADNRIKVIHEGQRNGFGSAIMTGIAAANGERLWIVPVDLPFPLETIEHAMQADADAVISFRARDPRSPYRRFQSLVFNRLARFMLGINVRNINSAFKLYRRAAVADMPLQSRGWLIDAEILAHLSRRKAVLKEIPVPLIERSIGQSKVGTFDALHVVREMAALRASLRRAQQ